MNLLGAKRRLSTAAPAPQKIGGGLLRKYVILFVGVTSAALVTNGIVEIWYSYAAQKSLLLRLQREQATAEAAGVINFLRNIEDKIEATTQLPLVAGDLQERQVELVRLLQRTPAITQIAEIDRSGREQLRVSRLAPDAVSSRTDLSHDPVFVAAITHRIYYGSVYFRRRSEPYMSLAIAGEHPEAPVTIAEINLKLVSDLLARTGAGAGGHAYLIDDQGRLVADNDLGLMLRNLDFSRLPQVRAALLGTSAEEAAPAELAEDLQGKRVLATYASVTPPGWLLFVETPTADAFWPIYASIIRSALLLIAALGFAAATGLFLARRMVVPIRTLRDGAAQLGAGDLGRRISIKTKDELEALGHDFNRMAARLHDAHTNLERKVEERTHELERANLAKSRFLTMASHDLRQPLQALGLLVAQLRSKIGGAARNRLVDRIDAAVETTNDLVNALLEVSRLDSGAIPHRFTEFPLTQLFERIEATFSDAAIHKGLTFRVVPCTDWIRSDPVLLERVVLNLVSNALRCTDHGGASVRARRRGEEISIAVCDTGPGIPADQQQKVFEEFYRIRTAENERREGFGLGLAIVDRLCRLLKHRVELRSRVGRGSRFAVTVPRVAADMARTDPANWLPIMHDALPGRRIAVVDDDRRVAESIGGLLRSWGCKVFTADTETGIMADMTAGDRRLDLIIADYHLANGKTGIETIDRLRQLLSDPTPALLISGDADPALMNEARARSLHVVRKPIRPTTLRSVVTEMLTTAAASGGDRLS